MASKIAQFDTPEVGFHFWVDFLGVMGGEIMRAVVDLVTGRPTGALEGSGGFTGPRRVRALCPAFEGLACLT